MVRQIEAEQVDEEKQSVEEDVAQAMAVVFGVTAEEIQQALREGSFVLPGEDTVGGDTTLLKAREILNRDSLRRRLEQRFDQQVPKVIREGFEVGIRRMEANISAEGAFNPNDPFVQDVQRRLNQQATGITDATERRINEVIRVAQDDPSNSVDDIAGKVVSEVDDMGALPQDPDKISRAQRIAATTTQTGFEAGQLSAMRKAGATGKVWLSMRDSRVRPGHLEADRQGQARRLEQPFNVAPALDRAEEQLMYPGDPSGSPANTINCRCTALPVIDEETFQEAKESSPDLSEVVPEQ